MTSNPAKKAAAEERKEEARLEHEAASTRSHIPGQTQPKTTMGHQAGDATMYNNPNTGASNVNPSGVGANRGGGVYSSNNPNTY